MQGSVVLKIWFGSFLCCCHFQPWNIWLKNKFWVQKLGCVSLTLQPVQQLQGLLTRGLQRHAYMSASLCTVTPFDDMHLEPSTSFELMLALRRRIWDEVNDQAPR